MVKENLLENYNEQIRNKKDIMIAKMPSFSKYVDIIQMTEQEILLKSYNDLKENDQKMRVIKEQLEVVLKRIEQLRDELTEAVKCSDETRIKMLNHLTKNLENSNVSLQKELIIRDTELRQHKTIDELKNEMLQDIENFDTLYHKVQTMSERNMLILDKQIGQDPKKLLELVEDIFNYNFIKGRYKPITEVVNETIRAFKGDDRLFVYRVKEELHDYTTSLNVLDHFKEEIQFVYDIDSVRLFAECYKNRGKPKAKDYANLITLFSRLDYQTPSINELKETLNKYDKSKLKLLIDINGNGNLKLYYSLIKDYDNRYIFNRFNNSFREKIYNNDLSLEFVRKFNQSKLQNLQLIYKLIRRINQMITNEKENLISVKKRLGEKYEYLENPITFFEKFRGLNHEEIVSKLADLMVSNEEIEIKNKIILLATRDAYMRGSDAINQIINNPQILSTKVIKKKKATQK